MTWWKHRFKDQLKFSLFQDGISPNIWETEAADHSFWQRANHFDCSTFEGGKRGNKKKVTQGLATSTKTITCPTM